MNGRRVDREPVGGGSSRVWPTRYVTDVTAALDYLSFIGLFKRRHLFSIL